VLDRLALAGRACSLQKTERGVEAILLTKDAVDGGIVPEEERIPRRVHLRAHGVLDLPGGIDPIARLIEEPAVTGYVRDCLEAQRAHRDQEQGDQEKRAQEL